MSDSPPTTPQLGPGRIAPRQIASDQGGWTRWLPGLQTLRRYEAAWLRHDIVAGLVLTTMLVPVGIAYAVASGVPGHLWPLRDHRSAARLRAVRTQPDSGAGTRLLAGRRHPRRRSATVRRRPARAVAMVAGMMAVVSGLVCILAGVARLGFITELLSKPIRYGYMNGIALTVLISQLPKLFGFSIESDGPLRNLWAVATAVLEGRTNWTAFMVGAGTLAVILLLKGSKRCAGHPDRRGRRDRRRWRAGSCSARRRVGPRLPPTGPACVRHPVDHLPPISSPS